MLSVDDIKGLGFEYYELSGGPFFVLESLGLPAILLSLDPLTGSVNISFDTDGTPIPASDKCILSATYFSCIGDFTDFILNNAILRQYAESMGLSKKVQKYDLGKLRASLGMTQKEAAASIWVSVRKWQRMERIAGLAEVVMFVECNDGRFVVPESPFDIFRIGDAVFSLSDMKVKS